MHKPVRQTRASDVAIVSDEPAGQHNRLGSQGPLGWWCDQQCAVPIGESPLRTKRCPRRAGTVRPISVGAKRAAARASLKPYWGKPAVRNYRGGGGNEARSGGHLPRCPKGPIHRKPLTYGARASTLLDWDFCPSALFPHVGYFFTDHGSRITYSQFPSCPAPGD
jgi:hypothetical protein